MLASDNGKDNGVPTVPQPHGGALAVGGTPGNKGGRGYKSRVTVALGEDLETAQVHLREKLTTGDLTFAEVVKYGEFCARFTVPVPKDGVDKDLVRDMAAVVGQVLKPLDNGDELLAQIHELWKPVIGKRL